MARYIEIGVALNELDYASFYDKRDYETAKEMLKTMPTADVVEVRHGKWIKNEDSVGWHCSYCGVVDVYAYSWNSETGKYDFQDNYCPNCGARMDEKEAEGE